MKKVTVSEKYVEGEWLLIETIDDLLEYVTSLKQNVISLSQRLIKSGAPVSRWDHMITKNDAGAILAGVVTKMNTFGCRPLLEMEDLTSRKVKDMLSYIQKGKKLLVNDVGGYCSMMDDWEITSEKEISIVEVKTYEIKENTKYINIENDDILESFSKKYLESVDKNYSHIVNLHSFTKEQLTEVFSQFKKAGGEVLYVYTSGINVPQMYEYTEAAIKAGIFKIEFDFNSGINENIEEYIKDTLAKGVNVSYKII